MNNKLYIIGDSYLSTWDGDCSPNHAHEKIKVKDLVSEELLLTRWVESVPRELGLEHTNLSIPGDSMLGIFNKFLYSLEQNPNYILIGLTNSNRLSEVVMNVEDIRDGIKNRWYVQRVYEHTKQGEIDKYKYLRKLFGNNWDKVIHLNAFFLPTLMYLLCKERNIKCYFIQCLFKVNPLSDNEDTDGGTPLWNIPKEIQWYERNEKQNVKGSDEQKKNPELTQMCYMEQDNNITPRLDEWFMLPGHLTAESNKLVHNVMVKKLKTAWGL
tara:strand:- start:456 stop:1262 length:807 start_codon:yes stop_codon:yes gene_type:complete